MPVNVSLIPHSLGCQAWVCGALGRRWADCFGETGILADLPQSGAGWHELEAHLVGSHILHLPRLLYIPLAQSLMPTPRQKAD